MFFNLFNSKPKDSIKPAVLLVLDGFGLAPDSPGNAVARAKMPNYRSLASNYPYRELIASGESVGLPANEMGNTEVGHLTLGAGRVVLQDLKRIDSAISNLTFFDNRAFLAACSYVKKNNSKMHLAGLISTGSVHANLGHLNALIRLCKNQGITSLCLHLFTDGRDSAPKEGLEMIDKIEAFLTEMKIGRIATLSGRYYAMDRDRRWERTEKAYKAMVFGRGKVFASAKASLEDSYSKEITDEFIEPSIIASEGSAPQVIADNDALIFFNFRIDRARQITMPFVLPDFESLKSFKFGYGGETGKHDLDEEVKFEKTFVREKVPQGLFVVTMTQYHKNIPVSAVAFEQGEVVNCLSQVISGKGFSQFHLAESEKQRFVTYYFDGFREAPQDGEDITIIPSPKVATYDLKPEMAIQGVQKAFADAIKKNKYKFMVVNIANPDMVAHTGNLPASIKALEVVDKVLGEMVKLVLDYEGVVFITSDHGNAEELITYPSNSYFVTTSQGTMNTDHSVNPVPFVVVAGELKGKTEKAPSGSLGDVAPTILNYLGIPTPPEMTGRNLL